jgi:hypothetical protein
MDSFIERHAFLSDFVRAWIHQVLATGEHNVGKTYHLF